MRTLYVPGTVNEGPCFIDLGKLLGGKGEFDIDRGQGGNFELSWKSTRVACGESTQSRGGMM